MISKEPLVRINKHNVKIKKLSIIRRIGCDYPILARESVAKKLAEVAKKLPSNLKLQVDSGHRSLEIQQNIYSIRKKQGRTNLVFNPSKGIPPHTTGGAIDISLVDHKTTQEINLSAPFQEYFAEPKLKSPKITREAQRLRLLVNKLMLTQDFAPNPREYWHFSYGDNAWAKYYKKKAIYNETSPGNNQYYSPLLRIYYRILRTIKPYF